MPVTEGTGRRHCIPIIYTKGTHYEVGYDVGRNFASIIHEFIQFSGPLNQEFLPAYETPTGQDAYNETLESVKQNFPQYIRELEGIADGAKVPFYKLFLLHMDDITSIVCKKNENNSQNGSNTKFCPKTNSIEIFEKQTSLGVKSNGFKTSNQNPTGCSTIIVNNENSEILGHTEDALTEVMNRFYIVSAHIITDKPQGKWGVKEEKFTSLCYAGHLPGYTMSYNHHGLVFSINTLSAANLQAGKTPRYFITRALLAAENYEEAQKILRDACTGAANGCSINLTFLNQEGDRLFHNIEMAPCDKNCESSLSVLTLSPGEHNLHTNKYLRLQCPQVTGLIIDSSEARMAAFKTFPPPICKQDVIQMLGDQSGGKYKVFQETGPEDSVKTIAVGIFDCKEKTWSLYADNPKLTEPLIVLPLILKQNNKIQNL